MKKFFILALILSFIWAPISHCAIPLRADTATVIVVGPFLDKTDGITAETAIVVSGTSCVAFKFNDSTQVAINLALTATGGTYDMVHIANGYYNFEVPTALVDTEGFLILSFTSSAAFLPQAHDYVVMDEIVYDSLYKIAATDYLRVDVTEIADTIVSAASAQLGVNVVNYGGDAVTDTVAGIPDVNVTYWEDDAVPASAAAGYPYVVIKDGTGTGEIDTDSGTVLLRSATETQIDNIETDTAAVDTQSELRTILVGSDVSLTTNQMLITAADSCRVVAIDAGVVTDAAVADGVKVDVNTILTTAPTTFIYSYSSLATNLIFSTDTMAEMAQGAPPGSPTMAQVLNYLYRAWRNKVTTTASSQGIYDDAGSAVLFRLVISDDGTVFEKAEIITGP